jgi:hypothetical protein
MQKYSPMFAYVRIGSLNARKIFHRRPGSCRWNGEVPDGFRRKLRALRGLCQDIVELRRGDHSGARLKMEQDRLEREREKTEEEVVAQFERWSENPAARDLICRTWASPEERQRRLRELFGLTPKPPEPPEATAPDNGESNPVKPSQTESDPIQPHPTKNSGPEPASMEPSTSAT